jgi:hypothetical protein
MNIMLDNSAEQIWHYREKYKIDFDQLRTPLTQYRRDQCNLIHYGLDNGAFSNFKEHTWEIMALEAQDDLLCDWVVLPDVVCDAEKTTENFWKYLDLGFDYKPAYVLVGGNDFFKDGAIARKICQVAKEKGKHVHVGRVNSPVRFSSWFDLADSVDGSGLSRFTESLEKLVRIMQSYENTTQQKITKF